MQQNRGDTTLPKIDSLKPVVVTTSLRPRMKRDTVEYNTENMRLRIHATVEDMLKRLPGLRIDPDGTIYYNGEKIDKLLVDGEDIFSSDPTIITRNFDGSKIARVQVLNRQSDQARFTGIDDGSRTKTLNLVMKESDKNGYFGKTSAGGDVNGWFNVDGFLAAFRDKEQFMALGQISNTGTAGTDAENGSGRIINYNAAADPLGASAGMGIPRYEAAAAHYANTWQDTKDHVTANYQISHSSTEPSTTTTSVQTLPNGIYSQYQQNGSTNRQNLQLLYGMYDWSFSRRMALQLTFESGRSDAVNRLNSIASSGLNGLLENSDLRTIQDQIQAQHFSTNLSWRIGMGKKSDHVFSINVGGGLNSSTASGYLYSLNRFFQNNELQSQDTVDERKEVDSRARSFGGGINYAEPLWKNASLGVKYGVYFSGDKPLQASYSQDGGKYDLLIDSLSSHYQTTTINQSLEIVLQGNRQFLTYMIGNSWLGYSYSQKDLLADTTQHWKYLNWAPQLRLNYTPNTSSNFVFTYSASTEQPTVAQLQPVPNNNDPLHVTLGNPDLKPAFNQNFEWEFHRFKEWGFNFTANLGLVSNAISTRTNTDSLGRQVSEPLNVDGGRTMGLNIFLNKKFGTVDVGVHGVENYSRSVNYVDSELSRNTTYAEGGGINLNQYIPDKYSIQLAATGSYFDQVSSINTNAPVHYWTQNYTAAISLFLIKDFIISTNLAYTWQGRSAAFPTSTTIAFWSASIGRNFLQNRLESKFVFNNILNTNAGISRTSSANVSTQSSTNVLGRYWMLSFIYHFDHKWSRK